MKSYNIVIIILILIYGKLKQAIYKQAKNKVMLSVQHKMELRTMKITKANADQMQCLEVSCQKSYRDGIGRQEDTEGIRKSVDAQYLFLKFEKRDREIQQF